MDPLSALREYTIRNDLEKIISVGGDLHFGTDYSFPSSTPTAYRSKQGGLYTLETLLFFLRHQHLKHTDYLQSSRLHRLPPVTLPDRKPLLDFLSGKTPSSDSIVHLLDPTPTATAAAAAAADERDDGLQQQQPPPPPPRGGGGGAEDVDFVSMIRSLERPLKDRESILECKNRDFFNVLTVATKREEERMKMEASQRKDGLVAKTRLVVDDVETKVAVNSHLKGVPIILVPSASQTLITIYNVKEFLEDGVFVASETKVKEGMARPECVTVQKKLSRDRAVAAYEVRDKTVGFKAEDWERVVAVFVLGKEWQFKEWPYKDHVEIFNKVIGFYVRFEDDSIESARNVKQWNVKIISISKNKRHQDRAAALEVWDRLEAFMRSRSHT